MRPLLALLAVVVLLAALMPASALAQDGDDTDGSGLNGESGTCIVELNVGGDADTAEFSVDCDDEGIESLRLETSENATIEGDDDADCGPSGEARDFDCAPNSSGQTRIGGTLTDAGSGDFCTSPRLTVTFDAVLDNGSTGTLEDFEVQGCDANSGDDEDDGAVPEGGVDSGAGGTADRGAPAAPALAALMAAIILTFGTLVVAHRVRTGR